MSKRDNLCKALEQVDAVKELLKEALRKTPETTKDAAHWEERADYWQDAYDRIWKKQKDQFDRLITLRGKLNEANARVEYLEIREAELKQRVAEMDQSAFTQYRRMKDAFDDEVKRSEELQQRLIHAQVSAGEHHRRAQRAEGLVVKAERAIREARESFRKDREYLLAKLKNKDRAVAEAESKALIKAAEMCEKVESTFSYPSERVAVLNLVRWLREMAEKAKLKDGGTP